MMHGIEPLGEVMTVAGRLAIERDLMVDQIACGALEPFFDRLLADKKRAAISEWPNPHRAFKVKERRS